MNARARRLSLLLVLSGSLLAACSQKPAEGGGNNTGAGKSRPAPLLVTTAPAELAHLRRTVEVTGSLLPSREAVLSSLAEGVVAELPVEIGSQVAAGQLLARVDDRAYRLQLEREEHALEEIRARLGLAGKGRHVEAARVAPDEVPEVRQARANLEQARIDRDRAEQMTREGLWPRQNLEQARTRYEVASATYQAARESVAALVATLRGKQAAVEISRKHLRETRIHAPFAARVQERMVNHGEYVRVGTPLLSLVALDPVKLRIEVPERHARFVVPGKPIDVRVDALPDRTFAATLLRVAPKADPSSRSFVAEALLANAGGELKPGFFARVTVVVERAVPVVLVPDNAIVTFAGTSKVFVVDGDVARQRMVRLGESRGGKREVLSGLRSGELVATSRLGQLADGTAVRRQEANVRE